MAEARPHKFEREVVRSQAKSQVKLAGISHWNARKPAETQRLLTLSEAMELFDLPHTAIYALANSGVIDALQRDGKGRVYYSEAQLRRAITKTYHQLAA